MFFLSNVLFFLGLGFTVQPAQSVSQSGRTEERRDHDGGGGSLEPSGQPTPPAPT